MTTEPTADAAWPDVRADDGWETHARRQFRDRLATTPAERLAWLEEAIRFAYAAGALPGRSREAVD